jgi:glyoxylase-like metal-dependent hydrolase (beta-lactamase superfamily II)
LTAPTIFRIPWSQSITASIESHKMKMNILSGGRLKMQKRTYLRDAPRGEMIELPVSCVLLRHPQGNVLFDTGCHPAVAEDPEARLGVLAKYMIPDMAVGDHVITSLKAVGLGPDDIDVVVCSHLHTDHCGCNAFFKKATVFVHALELAAAKQPDAVNSGYLTADYHQRTDRHLRRWSDHAIAAAGPFAGHHRRAGEAGRHWRVPADLRRAQRPRQPRRQLGPAQHLECRCLPEVV